MTSSAIVTAEACGFLLVLEPPLPVSRKGRCRSASRFDLETAGLHDLMNTLPLDQRYSYEFEGNAQVLDHILFSGNLFGQPFVFDPVHVNAEFWDQASDHDPSVVRLRIVTFTSLCDLVKEVVRDPSVASGLCEKLTAAAAAAARGSAATKDNQLRAFRNQVDAQTGKSISPDDANLLKSLSMRL